jgi:PEP-CTERM motif-containing protein
LNRQLRGLLLLLAFGSSLSLSTPASAVSAGLEIFVGGQQMGDGVEIGCVDDPDGVSAHCQVQDLVYPLLRIDEINLDIDSDPVVTGTTGVTNLFASTQQITLLFTLPIAPIPGSTLTGGSYRGTVTDNNGDGATVSAPTGSALYTALIDGANWQSLYPDPNSFAAGSFLSANIPATNFGSPIPSLPGPAALVSIGIRLDFNLTGFDSASFTSNHVVVPIPEPQTGALLGIGLAFLAVRRRRQLR